MVTYVQYWSSAIFGHPSAGGAREVEAHGISHSDAAAGLQGFEWKALVDEQVTAADLDVGTAGGGSGGVRGVG